MALNTFRSTAMPLVKPPFRKGMNYKNFLVIGWRRRLFCVFLSFAGLHETKRPCAPKGEAIASRKRKSILPKITFAQKGPPKKRKRNPPSKFNLLQRLKAPEKTKLLRNFIENHSTIDEVPSEKAGVNLELGENRWLDLIKLSSF